MRAFVTRFIGGLVFAAAAVVFAGLVSPDLASSVPWAVIIVVVVVAAAFGAISGFVADEVRWDPNTFGRDERTTRQLLGLDREQNRLRRQERRFANSALAGFLSLGGAFYFAGLEWFFDTGNPFNYLIAGIWVLNAVVLIRNGVRRWRNGGEFNLPGAAGPSLREPPKETRGD